MLYATRFDEKSLLSFIKGCNTKKVLYMNQEQERKVLKDQNGSKVRYRVLWTLKDEYLNGYCFINHGAYVKNLKKNVFTVIGYARKSSGQEQQEVRVDLVQKMVSKLYDFNINKQYLDSTTSLYLYSLVILGMFTVERSQTKSRIF